MSSGIEIFAFRLRELMTESKTSQGELASAIGITRQAVSKYMNSSTLPDCQTLVKIARHFNVSTDFLLGLTAVKTNNADVKSVCEFTGLSDEAVKHLHNAKENGDNKSTLINALMYDDGLWYDDIANSFAAAMSCYKSAENAYSEGAKTEIKQNADGTLTIDPVSAYRFYTNAAAIEFTRFMDFSGDMCNG